MITQANKKSVSIFAKWREWYRNSNINAWVIFFVIVYIVLLIHISTIRSIDNSLFFGIYSTAIILYLLTRFVLAYFYEPNKSIPIDRSYQPTVTFCVPVKNEEENIRETILKIVASDYPKGKLDVITINDGSTDRTLEELLAAKAIAEKDGVKVEVIDWKENRGKRHGMAECTLRSKSEILIFIDSDSFVEPDAAKEIVKYFIDPHIAAVSGHTDVANVKNLLTKMQSVRYYISFKIMKSAESIFGAVTCCSGCCAAYRRSHVLEVLNEWLNQKFLGVPCTYGDDRSLTNYVLIKGHRTIYASEARSHTFVPDTLKKYLKQQLRWKKSWTRESFRIGLVYMWKRNPILSISFYLGLILSILAPVVVLRAIIWHPIFGHGGFPIYYFAGLFLMACLYGIYYYIYTKDKKWFIGVLSITFYSLLLIWQLPWAIINLRDSRWGTR